MRLVVVSKTGYHVSNDNVSHTLIHRVGEAPKLVVVSQTGCQITTCSQCSRVITSRFNVRVSIVCLHGRTTLLVPCTSKVRTVIALNLLLQYG